MQLTEIKSAAQVRAFARQLFGADPADAGGVLQTSATWRDLAGARRVLLINDATPRSATDFFVLNLARARAEAILTTGRILRDEPTLQHALQGPAKLVTALRSFRHDLLGQNFAPWLLVLSSGRALDPAHPAFNSAGLRPLLLVPDTAPRQLARDFAGTAEVLRDAQAGPRRAIALLRERAVQRITVEAGPATARSLYEQPALVDELWRSTCEAPALPAGVAGAAFLSDEELARALPHRSGGAVRREESGRWRFERFTR